MADYYPILARAVSRLTTNNDQARQELYEHARTILDAQLLRQDPQISAPEHERIALEMAIVRVEAESPSMRERGPETLADYVPLHANDKTEIPFDPVRELHGDKEPRSEDGTPGWLPDFASRLREAAEAPPAPAQPEEIGASKKGAASATKDLGEKLKLLGVALLSIACIMAFTAIIYIRGLAK
jgi:hypothetical protein